MSGQAESLVVSRRNIYMKKIAVLTSGGDAPGMNKSVPQGEEPGSGAVRS